MKTKIKALSIVAVTGAGLVLGFQNCSQTQFSKLSDDSLNKTMTTQVVGSDPASLEALDEDGSKKCISRPLGMAAIDLGPKAEGHKILEYKIGEITCGYTTVLVKVKAYGILEGHLVYRQSHETGKVELISKSDGHPLFVYEKSVSVSQNNKYLIFSSKRMVDRSPTPVVPEKIYRLEIATGKYEIVNKYPDTVSAKVRDIQLPKEFVVRPTESVDGNSIIFVGISGRKEHLFKRDMSTGQVIAISSKNDGQDDMVMQNATATPMYSSATISDDGKLSTFNMVQRISGIDPNCQDCAKQPDSFSDILLMLSNTNLKLKIARSVVTGNGTDHQFDGVDEKVRGKSIISGDGRYVFFEGEYFGGGRGQQFRVQNRIIFKKDLKTGVSESVSANPKTEQVGGYWSLQSVSRDGRYVCFISTPAKLTAINPQTLVAENSNAYVKDLVTQQIVSAVSGLQSSSECAISADGVNVTVKESEPIDHASGGGNQPVNASSKASINQPIVDDSQDEDLQGILYKVHHSKVNWAGNSEEQ